MKKFWRKRSAEEIKQIVFDALDRNVNYVDEGVLGVPASYLDDKVFNQDASFLKNAPFMYALVRNPNHIGCHTLGHSESFFEGTQRIEKELLQICAVDILKGEPNGYDGYVASGGTEANLQAIWIYRNYFMTEHSARREEVALICSADSHYSMDKAGNVLGVDLFKIPVNPDSRELLADGMKDVIAVAKSQGKKYFIVICNMMTTMFGSVDDVDLMCRILKEESCEFKLHVDGAYGGFYYPFTNEANHLNFENPNITSFTLDAHKMAQAPYGTGIFLIRKDMIHYANTKEASYVEGEDFTLIGSRSGANAIAVWMILSKHGPYGWFEKVYLLQKRAEWLCLRLKEMDIEYYRNNMSNIITIKSTHVSEAVALRFGLVPDNHSKANWFKIVIMDHVTIEKLEALVEALRG